jgi:hypothetical protein
VVPDYRLYQTSDILIPPDEKKDRYSQDIKFALTSLRLRIRRHVEVAVRGFHASEYERNKRDTVRDFVVSWPYGEAGGPGGRATSAGFEAETQVVWVPFGTDAALLDIGTPRGIRITENCAMADGREIWQEDIRSRVMTPDFVTYNIRQWHVLKWNLTLVVAREKLKISGETAIQVVA